MTPTERALYVATVKLHAVESWLHAPSRQSLDDGKQELRLRLLTAEDEATRRYPAGDCAVPESSCDQFASQPMNPDYCGTCGWARDRHQRSILLTREGASIRE